MGNSDIAVLNRRMRSRMYGGVGGVSSTLPTRLSEVHQWLRAFQKYFLLFLEALPPEQIFFKGNKVFQFLVYRSWNQKNQGKNF